MKINFLLYFFPAMIIYWLLVIGIFIQATTCEELDVDETVLTAEEEEV